MPLDVTNLGTVAGRRWDPQAVLKLSLDSRCVGWAPSRGRKCRMPIRQDNAHRVEMLVVNLATQSPDPERLRPKLQRLAEHGLCVRFHQYQVDEMLDRWIKRMWEAFPRHDRVDGRVDATSERVRQRPGSAMGKLSTAHHTAQPSNNVSVFATSEAELAARAEVAALQESLRDAERRIEELTVRRAGIESMAQLESRLSRLTTSIDPPLSSSQPPNVLSNLRLRRSFAPIRPVLTAASGRETSPTTAGARPPSSDSSSDSSSEASSPVVPHPPYMMRRLARHARRPTAAGREPLSSASSSESSGEVPGQMFSETSSEASSVTVPEVSPGFTTPTPRCARSHARRLPFDDECPICQEGDLLSQYDRSEVVWCESTCGRTLHKTCFEDWRKQCFIDHRGFTCPVCRGDWEERSCEACDLMQVRRQKIEGDCAICCHAMQGDAPEGREDLVWCKNSCGQNVHRECFNSWKEHCDAARGKVATCVHCRTSWRREECDG